MHRIYRKAHELGCLKDEFYQILIDFSAQRKFQSFQELSDKINSQFTSNLAEQDSVEKLFTYVNEQVELLGLQS